MATLYPKFLSVLGSAAVLGMGKRSASFLTDSAIQFCPSNIYRLNLSMSNTNKPNAGFTMAFRWAVVSRGNRTPLLDEFTSSIALAAGTEPVLLTATFCECRNDV